MQSNRPLGASIVGSSTGDRPSFKGGRQQRHIQHADIIESLTQLFDVWQQEYRVRSRGNRARGWR